jgi:hypothetical protein
VNEYRPAVTFIQQTDETTAVARFVLAMYPETKGVSLEDLQKKLAAG